MNLEEYISVILEKPLNYILLNSSTCEFVRIEQDQFVRSVCEIDAINIYIQNESMKNYF